MSTEETLANIDAAIEDWELSPDAWRADGSHEHDSPWWTTQDMGRPFPRLSDRIDPYPISGIEFMEWVRTFLDSYYRSVQRAAAEFSRAFENVRETLPQSCMDIHSLRYPGGLVSDTEIEMCSHICHCCGSCDRCCDGQCRSSDESEQR